MALTIAIEGLGELDNAENVAKWGITGSGGSSFAIDPQIYYQGANSMSSAISSGKWAWLYYDHGSALNFSTTYAGQLVGIWFQVSTQGLALTLNGTRPGVSIRMGSGTGNFREWALGGSDYFANEYTGGWAFALIDPTSAGSGDTGTYSPTTVQFIGVQYSGNLAARSNNLFIDSIMVGSGIRITGTETTSGDGWQEVVDYCTDRASRAWGFIQKERSGWVLHGNMYIGDAGQAADTVLTDSGRSFTYGDYQYYSNKATPVLSSGIPDGYHGLTVEDAATFPTTFSDGIKVGTEAGRSGSSFKGAQFADTTFDLFGGSDAASLTTLYNTTMRGLSGGITWGDDADHEMLSVTVANCGQFDPVGAVFIRNSIFSELYDDGVADASKNAALLWNSSIDIQYCSFLANTHAGSDVAHGIEHPIAGTYSYLDLAFSGNEKDIHFSAATGDLTINKNPGSDPVSTTNDSTGSISILGSVDFVLTNVVSGSTFTLDGAFTTDTPAGLYNGAGDTVLQLTASLPASFATAGDFRVHNGIYYETYSYTGVSGAQLTGVSPSLSQDFNGSNVLLVMVAPTTITTDPYTISIEPSQLFEAMLTNRVSITYIPIQFSDTSGSGFSRRISQIEE